VNKLRKDPNLSGELTKLTVLIDLMKQGFEVTRTLGNFTTYDFKINIDGVELKVKCKMASHGKDDMHVISHAPKNGNFHILAIADPITGSIGYVFKTEGEQNEKG